MNFLAVRKVTLFSLIALIFFVAGFESNKNIIQKSKKTLSNSDKTEPSYPDLESYSIEYLSENEVAPGIFSIKEDISSEDDEYYSYIFEFEFDANQDGKENNKTTGLVRIPKEESETKSKQAVTTSETVLKQANEYPLVVMFRGYIDESVFQTGDGTRNASAYYAKNGYITIAPDFLGYGGSDENAANIFESRFQTYTTAISLINTIGQPSFIKATQERWNGKDVFLWGHSNGGHIALTTLEATGYSFPTTLWAPVTKPFPYSILFYTDDSKDGGKFIRSELAEFEKHYGTDNYSLAKYVDKINAKLQLHQGTSDTLVPVSWSNEFYGLAKEAEIEIDYHVYPGANHNLQPEWQTVVEKDVEFFNENLN